MTTQMINLQHQAALNEGEAYARSHGGSFIEDAAYGRGFKAGSIWFRNNVWHDADKEKPDHLPILHVWYHRQRCCDVIIDLDDINWQEGDLWCYLEDILPDVQEEIKDTASVEENEDIPEENKFQLTFRK